MKLEFDNSYARLPGRFYTRQRPVPVAAPELVLLNRELARELGLDAKALSAQVLAGNEVPEGAEPLAQAYSGHQFGNWAGQLGDGRAILLGEVVAPDGRRFDLQLKGAGRTPYSRGGDGRAWLGPVLREYIVSEAMHALGLPTTRALAVVTTGEQVMRDEPLPGAVLTRVAASHIRVGTFQHFAARGDGEAVQALLEHAIARHYPEADGPLGFLRAVMEAQARLIAGWMGVGFIHGVMNTDNMAISGETIDYGPCAFMDAFHPAKVFSSIDHMGRYAWNAQPDIGGWNLAQLAGALLPLLGGEAGIAAAQAVLADWPGLFRAAWLDVFRMKLGLGGAEEEDGALIEGLLGRMAGSGADFTLTFRALADGDASAHLNEEGAWESWERAWRARRMRSGAGFDGAAAMARANPALIARNHQVEAAIRAAQAGDFDPARALIRALGRVFDPKPEDARFALPPGAGEAVTRTFCGT